MKSSEILGNPKNPRVPSRDEARPLGGSLAVFLFERSLKTIALAKAL